MRQPAPGKLYNKPDITVKEQKLPAVDKFTYLGNSLSRAILRDDEVNKRIAKASTAILYACKIWTVSQCHAKKLDHFHPGFL